MLLDPIHTDDYFEDKSIIRQTQCLCYKQGTSRKLTKVGRKRASLKFYSSVFHLVVWIKLLRGHISQLYLQ